MLKRKNKIFINWNHILILQNKIILVDYYRNKNSNKKPERQTDRDRQRKQILNHNLTIYSVATLSRTVNLLHFRKVNKNNNRKIQENTIPNGRQQASTIFAITINKIHHNNHNHNQQYVQNFQQIHSFSHSRLLIFYLKKVSNLEYE